MLTISRFKALDDESVKVSEDWCEYRGEERIVNPDLNKLIDGLRCEKIAEVSTFEEAEQVIKDYMVSCHLDLEYVDLCVSEREIDLPEVKIFGNMSEDPVCFLVR